MVTSKGRFLVRFAVHLPPTYAENYLAELIEYYPARFRQLPDGAFEIVSLKPTKVGDILDMLKQEVDRGAMVIEETPSVAAV
jgi:hypothetical protein